MTTEIEVVEPVLRVLSESEHGVLTTGELRQLVRASLNLSAEDMMPLRNRADQRIDQTIRNLKSHRGVPGNPWTCPIFVESV